MDMQNGILKVLANETIEHIQISVCMLCGLSKKKVGTFWSALLSVSALLLSRSSGPDMSRCNYVSLFNQYSRDRLMRFWLSSLSWHANLMPIQVLILLADKAVLHATLLMHT